MDRVRETVHRHAMLSGGDRVLVGVSGGADSLALLHALRTLAPELLLSLSVLHVDHGLRPESRDAAAFVEDVCQGFRIPVVTERVIVDRRGSLEAQARAARYRALSTEAARLGAQRIALGHTADDQAETVLMRLLEGAGPRGLAGIPPVRGPIIRPLIEVRHREITRELASAGLTWREDPSNRDLSIRRNRIRHELIPFLTAGYNPRIMEALVRSGELSRQLVTTVAELAAAELVVAAQSSADAIVLPLARLRALPDEVALEMLRQAAERLGHPSPMRAWAHRGLRRVLDVHARVAHVQLGTLVVEASGDALRVARAVESRITPQALAVPGVTPLVEIGQAIEARLLGCDDGYAVPRGALRVAFDADRLPGLLGVRARQRGDRVVLFGEAEPRRLKSLLIAAAVARWERDRLPLVVSGPDIVWVAGVRRSSLAPVTGETRRVLELALVALAEARAAE